MTNTLTGDQIDEAVPVADWDAETASGNIHIGGVLGQGHWWVGDIKNIKFWYAAPPACAAQVDLWYGQRRRRQRPVGDHLGRRALRAAGARPARQPVLPARRRSTSATATARASTARWARRSRTSLSTSASAATWRSAAVPSSRSTRRQGTSTTTPCQRADRGVRVPPVKADVPAPPEACIPSRTSWCLQVARLSTHTRQALAVDRLWP